MPLKTVTYLQEAKGYTVRDILVSYVSHRGARGDRARCVPGWDGHVGKPSAADCAQRAFEGLHAPATLRRALSTIPRPPPFTCDARLGSPDRARRGRIGAAEATSPVARVRGSPTVEILIAASRRAAAQRASPPANGPGLFAKSPQKALLQDFGLQRPVPPSTVLYAYSTY